MSNHVENIIRRPRKYKSVGRIIEAFLTQEEAFATHGPYEVKGQLLLFAGQPLAFHTDTHIAVCPDLSRFPEGARYGIQRQLRRLKRMATEHRRYYNELSVELYEKAAADPDAFVKAGFAAVVSKRETAAYYSYDQLISFVQMSYPRGTLDSVGKSLIRKFFRKRVNDPGRYF